MKTPALTAQVLRFGIIGVSNTAVDFIVLNTLILTFGLTVQDPRFTLFKIISFLVALTNSFIWNRLWVFRKEAEEKEKESTKREAIEFFMVSIVSFLINIGTATIVYHLAHHFLPETSQFILANIGTLAGSLLAFTSNFFGYKFIVFRK
jgi:putative flippase GtrA